MTEFANNIEIHLIQNIKMHTLHDQWFFFLFYKKNKRFNKFDPVP